MEELILEEDDDFKTVATFEPDCVRVRDYDKSSSGKWLESWMYTITLDHLAKINAKLAEKESQR